MNTLRKWGVALAPVGAVIGALVGFSAHAETVEQIFPTASVQALSIGFLSRYVDLLLAYWPLIIGVAVTFAVVLMLLHRSRRAIHGRV